MSDERGVATAVGKLLELGVLVLFVALLTTTLYGSVLPGYRAAATDELGERALATAAAAVEDAVPARGRQVAVRSRVALPESIRGVPYRVRADGDSDSLAIEYLGSHRTADRHVALALPARVVGVSGSWRSDRSAVVTVHSVDGGVAVSLETGSGVAT